MFFDKEKSQIETLIKDVLDKSELQGSNDWDRVSQVYQQIETDDKRRKYCLRYLMREVRGGKERRAVLSVDMLQMLISMSTNDNLLLEMGSTEFESDLQSALQSDTGAPSQTALKSIIQKLAVEHTDSVKFNKIAQIYRKLVARGVSFPEKNIQPPKQDVSTSDDFEKSLKRAIELSLEEAEKNKSYTLPESRPYEQPQFEGVPSTNQPFLAKVLYDFSAEGPEEITVKSGDIVTVVEKCNQSWWKASVGNRVGLLPSNFVTPDLKAPVEEQKTIVDEKYIDQVISLLHDANKVAAGSDEEELIQMEKKCQETRQELNLRLEGLKKKEQTYDDLDRQFDSSVADYRRLMDESMQNYHTSAPEKPLQMNSMPQQPSYQQPPSTNYDAFANSSPSGYHYPQSQDPAYYYGTYQPQTSQASDAPPPSQQYPHTGFSPTTPQSNQRNHGPYY